MALPGCSGSPRITLSSPGELLVQTRTAGAGLDCSGPLLPTTEPENSPRARGTSSRSEEWRRATGGLRQLGVALGPF